MSLHLRLMRLFKTQFHFTNLLKKNQNKCRYFVLNKWLFLTIYNKVADVGQAVMEVIRNPETAGMTFEIYGYVVWMCFLKKFKTA